MPRIPEQILQCSVYLYANRSDAEAGRSGGGSGFLVGVASGSPKGDVFAYVVTNTHVAVMDPVMRLVDNAGKTVIREFRADAWTHHPTADVSIALMPDHDGAGSTSIGEELLLTEEAALEFDIGIGIEAFMVGRLMAHDGGQTNLPSTRFGHVSVMPSVIKVDKVGKQLAYLVEVRSMSGYSGSPVFVYDLWRGRSKTWLLGINCAHITQGTPVTDPGGKELEDIQVNENAGFAVVIPAWVIKELLYDSEIVREREKRNAAMRASIK